MQKRNILEYLDESARRRGDKVALTDGKCSLTFADLKSRAEAIGSHLIEKGFRRRSVLVLMDKHPDTVCAFLGALCAGCFYICVDVDAPDQRIFSILDKTRSKAVLCDKKSRVRANILRGRAEIISIEDALEARIDADALSCVRESAIDTDPAYIVFTSGSEGEPKGVCASHRSVIDYAEALISTLGFDEKTVFGNQAPLYYDAPLKELLPCLALGATVFFIPSEHFSFPVSLCRFIVDNNINTLCWAASALETVSALGALDAVSLKHLRTVCFGSESFSRREYDRWRAACPDTVFINLYGPTEATGMSAYWIADRELDEDEQIPIGRPFPNTEIFLIGEDGRKGDAGEIYIRGSSVTNGYFAFPERTEESFVQNPLNPYYPETVYKTGDMAKINGRGELVCLGRCDRQVKLMGRRIELGEIERAAASVFGVRQARVLFNAEKKRIMLAYVGDIDAREVISALSELLPRYMIPTRTERLECLPLMPNGKTDMATLKKHFDFKEKK